MTEQQERNQSYGVGKYRQEFAGFAPWPLISSLQVEERRADLDIALAARGEPVGVIGGWLAMSLRSREPLKYPAVWPPRW